jgi:hypothetical protein
MKRVSPELRTVWQDLHEEYVNRDEPGFGIPPGEDHDRGYASGWHDISHGIRTRKEPDGGFRDPERIEEFQIGYRAGRIDGAAHPFCDDWNRAHRRGKVRDLPAHCPWNGGTARRSPDIEGKGWSPIGERKVFRPEGAYTEYQGPRKGECFDFVLIPVTAQRIRDRAEVLRQAGVAPGTGALPAPSVQGQGAPDEHAEAAS